MSGVAAVSDVEVNAGLVPRYLRNGSADAEEAQDGAWNRAARQVARSLPVFDDGPLTEELRRRITEATKPEARRPRPLLLGMAALALVAASTILFPDVVLALLPNISASL